MKSPPFWPRMHAGPVAAVMLAALVLVAPLVAAAGGLSEAEKRGKKIYTEGRGQKPISAFLEGPRIKAPGSGFPCINCHAAEGAGFREGGVQSADITSFTLTKDFRGVRPSGRAHPRYTDETLKKAITAGIDPAGTRLREAHPRYTLGKEDLADLVAYLKVLGREPVPGITDNEVRVGILLPERGPLSEAGGEVREFLRGYFEEVNARGGLFRRNLTLVPVLFDPARRNAIAAAARGPVEKEDVFCFLANLGVPPDDEAVKVLSAARVPVIAPLLIAPESGYGMDPYTFHIYASVRDQARVMVDFLAEDGKQPATRVALLYASNKSGEGGADGAREQMKKYPLSLVTEVSFPAGNFSAPDEVTRLKSDPPDAVLFFGAGADALAFIREADRQRWRPVVLAPASMVGHSVLSLPPDLAESVYLAAPAQSPDFATREMADLLRLARKYNVPGEHRSFQILAFAGAKLLEEGLTRSGRTVTRAKLVDAIGSLWEFHTGVTPPLTYNENRRVGAAGAAILKMDVEKKRLVPASPWREPR